MTIKPADRIKEVLSNPVRPYFYILLLVLLGCVIINFRFDYPLPKIHDEFSYLLAADTFSKGRLTNPTHPQWTFFESFHIIHEPSYQSKYPPGQGMQLAAGMLLGHPIHGVWLTLALWAMALFWMLHGAGIPRHWAFFASLLGIAQFGVFSYFGHSYWGGSLFGLAGTLVFGAILHALRDRISMPSIINMGIGLIIMINTRPFEGFIFCIIPMIFFAYKLLKGDNLAKRRRAIVASTVILFVAAGTFMHGYYNKQVTGSWLLMPHSVYHNEYFSGYQKFVFEKTGEIEKPRYKEIETYRSAYVDVNRPLTIKRYTLNLMENIGKLVGLLFSGFWLAAAFLSLAACWREKAIDRRFAWGTLCGMFIVLFLSLSANHSMWPHYFSVWLPVAVFILADGIVQSKKAITNNSKILNNLLVMLLIIQLMGLSALTVFSNTGYKARTFSYFQIFRNQIQQTLTEITRKDGIKHVVMVKYSDDHNVHEEWVYNGADIDSQNVVWARWISPQSNKPLVEYYDDRQKWILEVGGRTIPKLTSYEIVTQ